MDRLVITITAGTLVVPGILLMGWIRILNSTEGWRRICAGAAALAGIASVLFIVGGVEGAEAIALGVPLYHVLLYRVAYRTFVHRMEREPVDVAMVYWGSGLFADRVFALTFVIGGVFSAWAVILPLIFGTRVGPA